MRRTGRGDSAEGGHCVGRKGKGAQGDGVWERAQRVSEEKQMTKRVTVKDIARAAGVSPQTVSHALSGADDISEPTRRKVKLIAERLNYVKNSAASSLRSGGTKMIAVVYDDPINLYFSFMVAYLHESLKKRGYSMLMMMEPVRSFSEELYLSVLSRNVDGILSFIQPEEELGGAIEAYGVPVVLVGRRSDVKNVDCIYTDDVKGGRIAAAYLADKGLKRIAFFSEDLDLTCARDRFEGYRAELRARKLYDEELCLFLGGDPPKECWEKFLDTGVEFDGVFCFSDLLACETVCRLKERCIELPVVGYDDVRENIPIPASFPSVGSDKRGIAEASVGFLLDRICERETEDGGRAETNAGGGRGNGDRAETKGISDGRRERMFDVCLVERK